MRRLMLLVGAVLFIGVAVELAVGASRAGSVSGRAGAVAPAVLDTSFGRGGLVRTGFGSGADDRARELVIQADGKIVAVGSAGNSSVGHDFALARYLPSGVLDTAFGKGGRVRVDLGRSDDAYGAVLQPDGKIVAAGISGEMYAVDLAVVRFNANGGLDRTFGSRGRLVVDLASDGWDGANAVALQRDGKILVTGPMSVGERTVSLLVRLTADGAIDRSFGTNGRAVIAATPSAAAVVIQPDGRIVVGGGSAKGFVLVRYRSNGSLDNGFGSRGIVVSDLGFPGMSAELRALMLQPDGKLVATGSGPGTNVLGVARYERNGRPDATFGSRGAVLTPLSPVCVAEGGLASVLQPDGRIVVAGGGGCDFVLARYQRDGTPDSFFGGTGVVTTDFPRPRDEDYASALVLQADGKLVAAGASLVESNKESTGEIGDFALARYLAADWRGTRFASLTVTRTVPGYVVRWRTAVEVGTLGFNVYREWIGRRQRLNPKPLPSLGHDGRGAPYSFLDRPPAEGGPWVYWLEELSREGRHTWFGPIVAAAPASGRAVSLAPSRVGLPGTGVSDSPSSYGRREMKAATLTVVALAPGGATVPVPGTISFVRTSGDMVADSSSDVFTVRGDGSSLRRVTSIGNVGSAVWSPDRKWLALTRETGSSDAIFVVRSSGVTPRQLTFNPAGAGSPSWSADSRYVAFNADGGVWISTPAGAIRRLTSGSNPVWHRSQPRTLAYLGKDGIYITVVGKQPRRLAGTTTSRPAAWSPDGRRLLLTGPKGIAVLAVATGRLTTISRGAAPATDPAWSPDGRRIVWIAGGGREPGRVWIAAPNGTGRKQLPSAPVVNGEPTYPSWPTWSPDSRRIAFSGIIIESCTLYVIPVAGGQARPLLPTQAQPSGIMGCDSNPVWLR